MDRKKKKVYNSYTEGNIRYMSCMICGRYEKVGDEALSIKCSRCIVRLVPLEEPKGYKPTGRPAGWHWMKEFVDTDGTVFHLGKEMKKLKGTLKPTKVKPPKKKIKRRSKDEILVARHELKKAALKKAAKKQQDFLNHNIKKG
tara:strand:+ start:1029 stop:1457 length:429 start_codon:yes stop_codon:yes gene_type:complete